MQTIEINGNIGDELCLKFGDATLVVKLGDGEIVPDFAAAATKALAAAPYEVLSSLNSVFHNGRGAKERFAQTMSFYRDRSFSAIQPKEVEKEEEDFTEKAPAKKKTSSKKKEQE